MAIDRTRTLRGALAGAAAAGAWAAQEPLDQRLFGYRYSDVALLGKAVTRGPLWPLAGIAMHVANGALFGAVYANVAPSVPLPPGVRGPLAGLAEHVATWPLTALSNRAHPARDEIPALGGFGRAFVQATWRHLVFGAVLGELERRLNPPREDPAPVDRATAQTNGHGTPEQLAAAAAAATGAQQR